MKNKMKITVKLSNTKVKILSEHSLLQACVVEKDNMKDVETLSFDRRRPNIYLIRVLHKTEQSMSKEMFAELMTLE